MAVWLTLKVVMPSASASLSKQCLEQGRSDKEGGPMRKVAGHAR